MEHWSKTLIRFSKDSWLRLSISVVCAVISVFGGLLPYYGIYRIVLLIIEGTKDMEVTLIWIGLCLVGYLGQAIFHMISTILSHQAAYTILCNIRNDLTDALMGAPLGVVLNEKTGRLKNSIVDRVESIEVPIAHMIPEGLSNLLLSISVFSYLIYIDYRMALAAFGAAVISFVIMAVTLGDYKSKYQKAMKTSDYVNSVIVEYSEGIEVIKMFNHSEASYEKYEKAINSYKNHMLEWMNRIMTALNFSISLLPTTLLGVVPMGIILYNNGKLTPAEFVLSVVLAIGIVPSLMNIISYVNGSKEIEYVFDETYGLLHVEQLKNATRNVELKNYNITFNGVRFGYNEESEVLKGIDLELEEGKFSALIGPSGSGKSTVAKLIARFWDVNDGKIQIGGVNIKDIPLKQLSGIVSFVTQDNFLFDCSLMDNIRMGNPEATNAEVIKAAQGARCHDFIMKLEKGYETGAGEAGNKLSGGEKQRITVARAMLKNAPIVILDEATTYTDPENEYEIQKSVSELSKGKTLIVIAHRLSTIKNADKIIIIDNGKIQGLGNHDYLMVNSPKYINMWEAHMGQTIERGEVLV